jgi:hypothetical protein
MKSRRLICRFVTKPLNLLRSNMALSPPAADVAFPGPAGQVCQFGRVFVAG